MFLHLLLILAGLFRPAPEPPPTAVPPVAFEAPAPDVPSTTVPGGFPWVIVPHDYSPDAPCNEWDAEPVAEVDGHGEPCVYAVP